MTSALGLQRIKSMGGSFMNVFLDFSRIQPPESQCTYHGLKQLVLLWELVMGKKKNKSEDSFAFQLLNCALFQNNRSLCLSVASVEESLQDITVSPKASDKVIHIFSHIMFRRNMQQLTWIRSALIICFNTLLFQQKP